MLAMVLLAAGLPVEEIEVRYWRPSTLVSRMRRGMDPTLAPGIQADDRKGVVRVGGTRAQRVNARLLLQLFDVAAQTRPVELRFYNPLERRGGETTLRLRNDQPWTLRDPAANLEIVIAMRINEDGTITTFLTRRDESGARETHARLRVGQTLFWDGRRAETFLPVEYAKTGLAGIFAPDFFGKAPEGWGGGTLIAVTQR